MRKLTKFIFFLSLFLLLFCIFYLYLNYSLTNSLLYSCFVFCAYFIYRFIVWLKNKLYKPFVQENCLILGDTGAGKTSLAVAQAIKYHKQMDKVIRKNLAPLYAHLKEQGYPVDIDSIPTFVYSDVSILLKKNGLMNADADFLELGIPDMEEFPNVAKYPLGAYFVFDETGPKADSRDWNDFNRNLSAYLTLHRKAYQSLNIIVQNFSLIEKRIRQNVHSIKYVVGMSQFHIPFTKFTRTTWQYIEFTGPDRFENCEKGKMPTLFSDDIRYKKFSTWVNVFERYDSRAEIAYFLREKKPFEIEQAHPFILTTDGIADYLEHHPLPEMKKKERKK